MTEPAFELTEADWCAIAEAKGYAAWVTAEYQRSQRRERSTQTEEQPTSPAAETEEAECQTDIQCAG